MITMKMDSIQPNLKYLLPILLLALVGAFGLQYSNSADIRAAYNAAEVGDWTQASGLFEAAAGAHPDHLELWEQAGIAAWNSEDFALAEKGFQTAYQFNHLGENGLTLWLELLQKTGRTDFAVNLLEQYVKSNKPSVDLIKQLAHLYEGKHQYDLALDLWEEILEINHLDAEANYHAGKLNLPEDVEKSSGYLNIASSTENPYQNEALKLKKILDEALSSEDLAHTHALIGQGLGSSGEWPLAEMAFRHSVDIDPLYAEGWAFLGESLFRNGKDGEQSLRNALTLSPYSLSANLFMGMNFRREGDLDKALEFFQFAAELDPLNPAVQVEIAQTYLLQSDLDLAAEAFQKAVSLSPYAPEYHLVLARFAIEYDYFLDTIGLEAAKEALRMLPEDSNSNLVMGRVYFALGERVKAQDLYQRALMANPENPEVYLHLALFYFEAGDRQNARTALEKVLSLAPGSLAAGQAAQILEKYFP